MKAILPDYTAKASVFRLRNLIIVGFYYLFTCATCFGHTTIFKYLYFPMTYSTISYNDN
jgi:hypothetical protein